MNDAIRPSRGRRTEALRALARETSIGRSHLIRPLFVTGGNDRAEEIASMPGVSRFSVDRVVREVDDQKSPAVLIFGVPNTSEKDPTGRIASAADGIVARAVRSIKAARPDLAVITDVCLCAYTDHGHCGILNARGEIAVEKTLEGLGQMALAHAAAGADVVAPSAMMDGQVAAIRNALNENGSGQTAIMSYAAKFASAFYGPFRDAADSAPSFGDRRSHQLPPANRSEAVRDALLDEKEGADWLMVKPALPYLDVIHELRAVTRLPIAAYQVSGEYAMLKHAAASGALDERAAVLESVLAIRRAGANAVITYYAEEICRWIAH
jgi:porphobilinogen synthase